MTEDKKHPLAEDGVTPIKNWSEWKKLWKQTRIAEMRMGLLHVGFDIPTQTLGDQIERIHFYLSIAEGHREHFNQYLFELKDENIRIKTSFDRNLVSIGTVRQKVARKAFEVLCLKLFKDQRTDEQKRGTAMQETWLWIVAHEELLVAILRFFRPMHDGEVANLDPKYMTTHHSDIAREFIMRLPNIIMGYMTFTDFSSEKNQQMQEIWRKLLPDLIELFNSIGELKRIIVSSIQGITLEKLTEIALRDEHLFADGKRRPRNIAEAVFMGSKAAKILLEHNTTEEIRQREAKFKRLEEERKETDLKLVALAAQ